MTTWNDYLELFPDAMHDTIVVSRRTTWQDFGLSMYDEFGVILVPFYANGDPIPTGLAAATYCEPGQHTAVYRTDGTRPIMLIDLVASSDTGPSSALQLTSGTSVSVRPTNGFSITINNTNINGTTPNIGQLVRMAQGLAGMRPFSPADMSHWDLNGNGKVDIADLAIFASHLR